MRTMSIICGSFVRSPSRAPGVMPPTGDDSDAKRAPLGGELGTDFLKRATPFWCNSSCLAASCFFACISCCSWLLFERRLLLRAQRSRRGVSRAVGNLAEK